MSERNKCSGKMLSRIREIGQYHPWTQVRENLGPHLIRLLLSSRHSPSQGVGSLGAKGSCPHGAQAFTRVCMKAAGLFNT